MTMTLDEAKQSLQRVNNAETQSINENCHRNCPTCGHSLEPTPTQKTNHNENARRAEAQRTVIKNEMLADPLLAPYVCTDTVMFQAPPVDGYSGNSAMDAQLKQMFPMGCPDSESGQGFFYVNLQFLRDVMQFLRDKGCTDVKSMEEKSGLVIGG